MNRTDGITRLNMLASAIALRSVRVAHGEPSELAWTDGNVLYLDPHASPDAQLVALTVQASLLAAGSLARENVIALVRRPALMRRYLAVEGQRALSALAPVLPGSLYQLAHQAALGMGSGSERFAVLRARVLEGRQLARAALYRPDSPAASLAVARGHLPVDDPPASFGTIHARRLLAAVGRSAISKTQSLVELADESESAQHNFASPVGGGGAIGKWLSKLMAAARQLSGGGSPGADAPTHFARGGSRGPHNNVYSAGAPRSVDRARIAASTGGTKYPEWDADAQQYRMDFCTVRETEVVLKRDAARFAVMDRIALRRALARIGLGIDRYHRQAQGDDIDIDAAIEARVALFAGCAPDEDVFIHSVRRRRDLSVLLLLDISGSAAEPAHNGKTIHEQQRATAAALTIALHELGDRVALYAYNSQGRDAISLLPIKRFAEALGGTTLQRLGSLAPGAYSRLGAAIRHGTAQLKAHGGTPRQLLVVLSDGLAYDHGYEPAYGAADARRALGEARNQGVGCLCLSVGAATDHESLRRVFGSAAHAALLAPEQLCHVVGPLFRSAIRSADVRRIVS